MPRGLKSWAVVALAVASELGGCAAPPRYQQRYQKMEWPEQRIQLRDLELNTVTSAVCRQPNLLVKLQGEEQVINPAWLGWKGAAVGAAVGAGVVAAMELSSQEQQALEEALQDCAQQAELKVNQGELGQDGFPRPEDCYSAGWAVRMGVVAVQNGDDAEARRWLETATALEQQSDSLTKLDRRLNDLCCNKLAARLGAPRVVGTGFGGSYAYVTVENVSPVPLKKYQAKAEVLSSEGFPVADSNEYGHLALAPGQTRELKFTFFSVPKAKIADVRVELTSISVDGLDRADPSFWVRKAPPATAEASANTP